MSTIFPKRKIPYNLRNENNFESSNVSTVLYGTETISFRGPKTWLIVPDKIKYSKTLTEFKKQIKDWLPINCDCRLCKTYVCNLGFI